MAKRLAFLLAVGVGLVPTQAVACAIVADHQPDYFERRAEAKRILSLATLILDGEVVEVGARTTPAKIKVSHVIRGPQVEYVLAGADDSCDITFDTKGERNRFVLQGGPDIYTTWVDSAYAPEIDRMLKSDRRKVWPYYNPANPPKRRSVSVPQPALSASTVSPAFDTSANPPRIGTSSGSVLSAL